MVWLANGNFDICSQEKGSTYSAISRDLFTHITDHGCRNHNYLDYPSQESDSCVCSNPHATESFSTKTTSTTTTTETTSPQDTITPTTTIRSDVTTTTHHRCNKYEVIEDIAKSIHVTHPDATPCDSNVGGSDDAYTIVACNMVPPRTWMKGINVMSTCRAGLHSLPTYIPIATFSPDRSNFMNEGAQSGIFLGCEGNGIKMAVQRCNEAPTIIHVANGTFTNNQDNYYTIV